jgi:hypothetical protein
MRLLPTVGKPVDVGDKKSADVVEVRGRPSELLLLAYNRTADADVEFVGEPVAVERARASKFGI